MGLKAYVKIAWPVALLYGLIFCLLWVCFALYRLPLMAVAYPMGLGLALLACYFVWDFGRERRRYARQKALEAQLAEVRQEQIASQEKTAQRMEYYSVWAHQIKTPIAAMGLKLQESDTALSRSLQYDLNRIESYAEMVLTYLRLDGSSTDYVLRRQDKRASGIGLYLCRRICAGLGHGISAQSEVGVGTVIRLNLQEKAVEMN